MAELTLRKLTKIYNAGTPAAVDSLSLLHF
jgi:hypothetical protein